MDSVLSQQFLDYEIIAVNDGSTDATDEYLSLLASAGKITYVKQRNLGPAAARNTGVKAARGIYLAFTDDDCVVPPHWLQRFVEAFSQSEVEIVGGIVKNCIQRNIYSEVSQEIVNHLVTFLNENGHAHGFLTSNNIAYRTQVIRDAGGFDERFRVAGGEERALNAAILRRCGKSLLLPDVVVDHYHAMTARTFFRQQRNYGRGSYRLYHRQSAPPRIPLTAYTTLAASWLEMQPLAGLRKVALLLAAQMMVACGFIAETVFPHLDSYEAGT